MKIELNESVDHNIIAAYDKNQFTVGGKVYEGSLLISPGRISAWENTTIEQLGTESVEQFLEFKPVSVLLGTGPSLVFPPDELMGALARHAIGLEVMDTPAACRTYNILVAEGRPVLAALIAL